MGVSKVVYNGNTLIDLTSDTVTADKLAKGYTAHTQAGELITGTMESGGGATYDDYITYITGASTSWTAPNVETLRPYCCAGNTLTEVTLPEGLKTLGDYAFTYSTRLKSITLPSTLTTIGKYCFGNSALTSIEIPEGVTELGYHSFAESQLTSVSIPSTVYSNSSTGSGAFYDCYMLSSVSLAEGITSLGQDIFMKCSRLQTITLPQSLKYIPMNMFYSSGLKTITTPPNVIYIFGSAFAKCSNLTTAVIEGNPIIQSSIFWEVPSLKTVTFTGSPTLYDNVCSSCTALTTVTFKGTPESMTSNVFNSCTALTDIYVPWAEGAVANAPWGATNATIHYNTTYDE